MALVVEQRMAGTALAPSRHEAAIAAGKRPWQQRTSAALTGNRSGCQYEGDMDSVLLAGCAVPADERSGPCVDEVASDLSVPIAVIVAVFLLLLVTLMVRVRRRRLRVSRFPKRRWDQLL